jgi:multiple sugar transport system permease protein
MIINKRPLRHWIGRFVLHLVLMSLGLLFIFPFIWSMFTSLKSMGELFQPMQGITPGEILAYLVPAKPVWENYQTVFDTTPFERWYLNTIIVTVVRTLGGVFIASLAGFAFAQLRFRGRDLLFFVLLAGMMVPDQVLIVPRFILMREFDWIDSYQGLIIPLLFSSFGVFLLRQFFLGIPKDFMEAAKLEGASPFRVYWDIYLPLARPALSAFGFLTVLWSWNEFLWALTITNSNYMKVLSVGLALFEGQFFTNTAVMMAAANLATLPLLILFLFFQKQLVEGIALSGLKG